MIKVITWLYFFIHLVSYVVNDPPALMFVYILASQTYYLHVLFWLHYNNHMLKKNATDSRTLVHCPTDRDRLSFSCYYFRPHIQRI